MGEREPFIVALLAFGLLFAGLAAFLLSTRQMRLPIRAINWALGAALLGASLFVVAQMPSHIGLLGAVASSGAANSLLAQALEGNWRTVADAVPPMFDAFWVFGAVMALFALIALTPGELVERFTRPLIYATVGACAGGFLALTLVAMGFGGYQKRQVYFTVLSEADVIDGDTLQMGDMRFRLAGIDAPELGQICLRGNERRECGIEAREKLVALVRDKPVSCYNPDPEADNIRESHGRPVVSCKAQGRDGSSVDVAGYLIREGAAVPFGEEQGVDAPDYTSLTQHDKGVWTMCSLEPSVWRRDRGARDAFLASGVLPEAESARLGTCPRPVVAETQGVAAQPASAAGR